MGWLQLIGQGIGAAQDISAGKQAEADAETQARIGRAQASDALVRSSIEEQRYRREIAQIVGAQRAVIGARNVSATGSALDILSDTAQLGEEDVLTIRNNAAREAWGYRNQANEASRWGANEKRNLYGAAAGSLLTAGAQAYGTYGGAWKDKWRSRDEISPVSITQKRVGG